jgi:hypothetical protein
MVPGFGPAINCPRNLPRLGQRRKSDGLLGPRFYYEVRDGDIHARDDEGEVFADRKAARDNAVMLLTEMARSLSSRGKDQNKITASVRDETGKLIFTATLSLDVRWND